MILFLISNLKKKTTFMDSHIRGIAKYEIAIKQLLARRPFLFLHFPNNILKVNEN